MNSDSKEAAFQQDIIKPMIEAGWQREPSKARMEATL